MNKPVIGVLPLFDNEKESYWMLPRYYRGLQAAGAIPVMLPLHAEEDAAQLVELFDGLLFPGGQDVDPALYGEEMLDCCKEIQRDRDSMETAVLQEAMARNLPILGICRGLQFINAALGGTLWQDLLVQRPGSRCHRMERPYDRTEHSVSLTGPLALAYGTNSLGVNSCHHQGVKTLAACLEPMAVSDDGLIEAFYHPGQSFLWAVQWHPEFAWRNDPAAASIFEAFVSAC